MKLLQTLFIFFISLSITSNAQTAIMFLENNKGIEEDSLGSVVLWENQIEAYGDATQSVSALGGEQMQESYPGKVNVGFYNEGSHMILDGTNEFIKDNSFSVFYVGKATPTNKGCSLVGNYVLDGSWSNISGLRLIMNTSGTIKLHWGNPYYHDVDLGKITHGGYFFIGFSMDENRNYKYFDSTSDIFITGTLDKTITHNDDDFKFNIFSHIDGEHSEATEVVEFLMYDDGLNDTDFQAQYDRLAKDYADLVESEFSVKEVSPSEKLNISKNAELQITFSLAVDTNSVLPEVSINKGEITPSGKWELKEANVLTYKNSEPWPYGALVSVKLTTGLTSTDNIAVDIDATSEYIYLVETENNYTYEKIELDAIATVDYPQAGHKLPLKMVLPTNVDGKLPIHIWVHGGGWSGGSAATSNASYSPHDTYLAEKLGIATLGIAYRCTGSSGKFNLAMEDIDAAYQWAIANAEKYNFDTTKVFFSGGSAGTPLAALASQRYSSVIGFIGFNGIYDFLNDAGNSWGRNDWYGQETPTAEANSAIFNLRENPPATIVMHGDADNTILYTQSTLFADAINAAGGQAEAVIYPGEVHAFFNQGKQAYEDVLWEMVRFIEEIIEQKTNTALSAEQECKEHKIYPNPTSNLLHIEGSVDEVSIYDLCGVQLYKSHNNNNNNPIDTSQLNSGTYIICISDHNGKMTTRRMIKE